MHSSTIHKQAILSRGFTVTEALYLPQEVAAMAALIDTADHTATTFRKSTDLFAIRQVLKEIPGLQTIVFIPRLIQLLEDIFGKGFFPVKSIYFDKPAASNWYVAYHQDLTISVDRKVALDGFGPWTVKQQQFAVQPPLALLNANFTVRIHLDDTDETNGALKVIEGSHNHGIRRPETIDLSVDKEVVCSVPAGGIMIMKPLLLHSSGRSSSERRRRVIHIEFSAQELPEVLSWSERLH